MRGNLNINHKNGLNKLNTSKKSTKNDQIARIYQNFPLYLGFHLKHLQGMKKHNLEVMFNHLPFYS